MYIYIYMHQCRYPESHLSPSEPRRVRHGRLSAVLAACHDPSWPSSLERVQALRVGVSGQNMRIPPVFADVCWFMLVQ